jgi:hypothetical protein
MSAFPENAIAFLTGKASGTALGETDTGLEPVAKPVSRPQGASDSPSVTPPEAGPSDAGETAVAAPPARPRSAKAAPSRGRRQPAEPRQGEGRTPASRAASKQTAGLSARHKAGPSASQSQGLSIGRALVADRLNANQKRVLDLLLAADPYIIKFRDIAHALGMREASVRTILRRLEALSFLTFGKARDGAIQGIRLTFNQALVEQYRQDQAIDPGRTNKERQTVHLTTSLSQDRTQGQSLALSAGGEADLFPAPDGDAAPRREAFADWDDALVELMWPRLAAAGFRLEHIRRAAAARGKLGKTLERDRLTVSLDRAEWELEATGQLLDLPGGEKVDDVAAYLFAALARRGVFRAHPDYVSREEKEAREAAEELRRRKDAARSKPAATLSDGETGPHGSGKG